MAKAPIPMKQTKKKKSSKGRVGFDPRSLRLVKR